MPERLLAELTACGKLKAVTTRTTPSGEGVSIRK